MQDITLTLHLHDQQDVLDGTTRATLQDELQTIFNASASGPIAVRVISASRSHLPGTDTIGARPPVVDVAR